MMRHQRRLRMNHLPISTVICLLVLSMSATANPLRIAVASNFRSTLDRVLPEFRRANPNIETQIVTGSTGALYAQISHGAPYDLLLAADAKRPQKLLAEHKAVKLFHYATGRLVFWAAGSTTQVAESTLKQATGPIAVANPKTAPYGAAAMQALASLNIQGIKFITGSSVSQTYQFIESGNVTSGFVAQSQVINRFDSHEWWLIPSRHYDPIIQLGALLPNHHASAETFMKFILSASTQRAIFESGYKSMNTDDALASNNSVASS